MFFSPPFTESLRSALQESDTASKTERSKSYDEGLDNYQEEGRGWVHTTIKSLLPPSFFFLNL